MPVFTSEQQKGYWSMWKQYGKRMKHTGMRNRERVFYVALILAGFSLIVFALSDIISNEREYAVARSEYEQLREIFPIVFPDNPPYEFPTSWFNSALYVHSYERQILCSESVPAPQINTGFRIMSTDFIPVLLNNPESQISSKELTADTSADSKFWNINSEPAPDSRVNANLQIPDSKSRVSKPIEVPKPIEVTEPIEVPRHIKVTVPIEVPKHIKVTEPIVVPKPIKATEPIKVTEPNDPITGLTELNPDYIGWITINGVIDYPVVLGNDNSRYLNTTFTGRRNFSGTIFMDYRNTSGFQSDVCILYGHNMRDGSMFAALKKYLDPKFLSANSGIAVMTSKGEALTYKIFATKQTDVWDKAYTLSLAYIQEILSESEGAIGLQGRPSESEGAIGLQITPIESDGVVGLQGMPIKSHSASGAQGAPEELGSVADCRSNFLLLSTCVTNEDKNARLLVYAKLEG